MVTDGEIRVAIISVLGTCFLLKLPDFISVVRDEGLFAYLKARVVRVFLKFGKFKEQLQSEEEKVKKAFQEALFKHRENRTLQMPLKGLSEEQVLKQVEAWHIRDLNLTNQSRISGAVYYGDSKVYDLAAQVMKKFIVANPLHPDIFPCIRQMESEIVQMTIQLYKGGEKACGVITSGGTESIVMAMLAYREWGKLKGIKTPEIVCCRTAHVAFEKAAYYLGMKIRYVEFDKNTQQIKLKEAKKKINRNTVVLVGSAPNYASGILDPLEELGKLAHSQGINFHIDACLGGYLLPFMEEAGYSIEPFDFRVTGVTSISCDPHKYGYTPKGVSVVMYNSPELRRLQYYSSPDWTGGIYATPTIAGSRNGAIAAGSWAVLMHFGRNEYVKCTAAIMKSAAYLKESISEIPQLKVLGNPKMNVVAFNSDIVNVHAIADAMGEIGGWSLNYLQYPTSLHFCVTYANCGEAEAFVEDLKKAVHKVESDPNLSNYEKAAMYGMATQVPDKQILGGMLHHFLDCLFTA